MLKKGVVIGKFMPLHKGHVNLINFAKNFCDYLTVLVDNYEPSEISLLNRVSIVGKEFNSFNTRVIGIDKVMPQKPEDCQDFWIVWKDAIIRNVGYKPNYIIGAENYVYTLAKYLDCEALVIDNERNMIPISGTDIRKNPYTDLNWNYLSNESKKFFLKKIAIVGPESIGKTTLTRELSKTFNTCHVEEFARFYLESIKHELIYSDMETIAKGHSSLISTVQNNANKILFIDTDFITTKIWSQKLFGKYPIILDFLIEKTKIDHYFILDINTEWVQDGIRYFPDKEDRKWFFNEFIEELEKHKFKYNIITGNNFEEKTEKAKNLVLNFKKEYGVF